MLHHVLIKCFDYFRAHVKTVLLHVVKNLTFGYFLLSFWLGITIHSAYETKMTSIFHQPVFTSYWLDAHTGMDLPMKFHKHQSHFRFWAFGLWYYVFLFAVTNVLEKHAALIWVFSCSLLSLALTDLQFLTPTPGYIDQSSCSPWPDTSTLTL
jgi:hypothetical protein